MKSNHNIIGRCLKAFMLCLMMVCTLALKAQDPITSVHGVVEDEFGPLMSATVCEIDGNGRVVSSTLTDMNGNFSMKVINPKDKIRFQYVGMNPIEMPINKSTLNITMQSNTVLQEVTVKSERRSTSSSITLPERNVAIAKQTISTEDFEGLAVTTIDEAMQGRLAGLDIMSMSGNLGSAASMKSRGGGGSLSSVTGNDVLIVVDGNITDVNLDGFDISSASDDQFAELLNINVEDIADINFLKDLAATLPYGSRGANGVIEFTTKRGKIGKPTVRYSFTLKGDYQPEGMKLLNGDDYTMMLKEAYFNPRQDDAASNIPEISYDPNFSEYEQYNNNTDWRKAVTQIGLQQQHQLTISGGGDKTRYFISGSYDHNKGTVIKQQLDRFTTRANLDYFISRRIKVSTNFSMTYTNNHKNYDNLLPIAIRKMPNMSIYEQDPVTGKDTDRYYNMLQSGPYMGSEIFKDDQRNLVNPVASANLAKYDESSFNLFPELVLNYKLLGTDPSSETILDYQGNVNMHVFSDNRDRFFPSELVTTVWTAGHNTSSVNTSKSFTLNTRHRLTYQPYLGENHFFQMTGTFELSSGNTTNQSTSGKGLPSGGITSPDAGGKNTGLTSGYGEHRRVMMFSNVNYSWKGRYVFNFGLNFEGTTKFGKDRRWGVSPAGSFRWNIYEEPFMEATKSWLNEFAVSYSWARANRGPGADYLYTSKYGSGDTYLDMNAMVAQNLYLANMQYEHNYENNFGIWYRIFDRFFMRFDGYIKTNDDMLMSNYRIPSNAGFPSVAIRNTGKSRNTGWDLQIDARGLVKKGKFNFDMNVNLGNNKSELLEMDESILKNENNEFTNDNAQILKRVQVHNPLGSIYGFRSKGVYQYEYETFANMTQDDQREFLAAGKTAPVALDSNGEVIYNEKGEPVRMMFAYTNDGTGRNYTFRGGDAIYEDVNHDGNINSLDIVYLGSSLPTLHGGFGFTATYGKWRFSTQFTYRVGYKIVNMARLNAESMRNNDNQSQAVNYRWRKEGDVTTIPRAMYGNTNYNTLLSDRFVEDGNYLRANYFIIGYSMNNKFLKNIGVKRVNLNLNINNLFCLTKYTGVDPDVSAWGYEPAIDRGQTPRPRSFSLKLIADF